MMNEAKYYPTEKDIFVEFTAFSRSSKTTVQLDRTKHVLEVSNIRIDGVPQNNMSIANNVINGYVKGRATTKGETAFSSCNNNNKI